MKHSRRGLVALFAVTVTLLAGAPAAAANTTGKDPAIAAALSRIAAGTSTTADISLIRSRPEIAAQVIDPTRTTVTITDKLGSPAVGTLDDLPTFPAWYEVEITAYTLLGFVHWKWKHHVDVYLDGVVVRQWTGRFDQLTYSDGTAYVGALLSDAASATPTTPAYSFKQRRLDICVFRYGCYATSAPYSQININGDGSWWYSWGVV